MKKLTKLSLLALISMLTFSISSCTKDLEDRMDKVEDEVAKLATSLTDLNTKLSEMTYIKSIAIAADGKMTITPSTGSAVVYDAKSYITQAAYEFKFENNKLWVKGPGDATFVDKGTVAFPEFPEFPEIPTPVDPKLSVVNGELLVNGVSQNPKVMIEQPSPIFINKDAETGEVISVYLFDASGEKVEIKVNDTAALTNEPLSSMLFIPAIVDDGYNAIEQGYINEVDELGLTSANPVSLNNKVMFNAQMVNFRVNPTSANVAATTWKFLNNEVLTRASNGDAHSLYTTPTAKAMDEVGSYTFELAVNNWVEPTAPNNTHLIALEGTTKDAFDNEKNAVVVSDYVKVMPVEYLGFVSNKKTSTATLYEDYSRTMTVASNVATQPDHKLVFDATVKTNLNDLVLATAQLKNGTLARKLFEQHGFKNYHFTFENITWKGSVTTDETDQAAFIKIESNGDITVEQGHAAISRTPIVKVLVLNSANEPVAEAFIKFVIVEEDLDDYKVTIDGGSFNYNELYLGLFDNARPTKKYETNQTPIAITWQKMNNIYTELRVSHDDFVRYYANANITVAHDNAEATAVPNRFIHSSNKPGVDSYAYKHLVTPYAPFGQNTVTYTFTPQDNKRRKLIITFTYNVVKPVLPLEILVGYRYNNDPKTALVKGMNISSAYQMKAYLGEAFSHGSAEFRAIFADQELNKIGGATHQFLLNATYDTANRPTFDGTIVTASGSGSAAATLDATFGTGLRTGVLMGLEDKLITAERTYKMSLRTNYINGATDDFFYNVRFENPLTIELAPKYSFSLEDLRNGQTFELDTKLNYIVKFNGLAMVTKGVAETGVAAGTVNAADYVDMTQTTLGLFYYLTPTTQYFTVAKKLADAKDGVITWTNGGTTITTNVSGGKTSVKFVTSFAELTVENDLTIVPGVVPGA